MNGVKILASGDDHFCEHARLDECIRMHQFMVDVAREERVDCFISTGDMFERPTSTPVERRAVADFLRAMAEVCPVLHAHGNHGNPKDMQLMMKLQTRHPVIVETAAAVHHVAGAAIGLMAWPERARLAAAFQGASAAELDTNAEEMLRNVVRGLGAQMADHSGPRLLAGHFMVDGSVTSVGQPLIGQAMAVGLTDLALADVPLVLMGHVHAPQHWRHGETDIVYTGSSFRTTYGEIEEKSIVLAEFDGSRLVGWRRIPTPCAPMLLLEDEWCVHADGGAGWLDGAPDDINARGAEIRFRFRCDADQRAAARAAAETVKAMLLEAGAIDVKLDPIVNAMGTARAPEVARAVTLLDKLRAYWAARQATPEKSREERLLGKAASLEESIHAI